MHTCMLIELGLSLENNVEAGAIAVHVGVYVDKVHV